jgi:hypothetical protein
VKLAHENPLTPEFIGKLSEGFDPKDPATRPKLPCVIPLEFTIDIPDGFRVTYTEEQQPMGLCRHISVSVADTDRVPNPVAIQMLLSLFGFERLLGDRQMVYPEKYGNGLTAINVIEPMEMADAG